MLGPFIETMIEKKTYPRYASSVQANGNGFVCCEISSEDPERVTDPQIVFKYIHKDGWSLAHYEPDNLEASTDDSPFQSN